MIRKLVAVVEQAVQEAGQAVGLPMRRAAADLYAGRFQPSMGALTEVDAALGGGSERAAILHLRSGAPLRHKDAAHVRSHHGEPRARRDEVAGALIDGGRPPPRVGGLQAGAIEGHDGLR